MKIKKSSLLVSSCLAVAVLGASACHLLKSESDEDKESAEAKEPAVIGSIRPEGKPKPADLPALAKITLPSAMDAALNAVPGNVVTAELEVKDGNLQYSFDIVGADKSVTEVEIDAGNGKVLATEKEDGKGEDKD
jgi:uncharacterized membrane protein YkoI